MLKLLFEQDLELEIAHFQCIPFQSGVSVSSQWRRLKTAVTSGPVKFTLSALQQQQGVLLNK